MWVALRGAQWAAAMDCSTAGGWVCALAAMMAAQRVGEMAETWVWSMGVQKAWLKAVHWVARMEWPKAEQRDAKWAAKWAARLACEMAERWDWTMAAQTAVWWV